MLTIKVKLEVITPLFLGDAEQEPEWRVPSLRGALRMWFRALAGVGRDAQAVAREESQVFGSTTYSSPVRLRVLDAQTKSESFQPTKKDHGAHYLWFSLRAQKDKAARSYFIEQQGCTLQLQALPHQRDALIKAATALWLLVNFGGLGSRSRRCAGALRIVQVDDPAGLLPFDFISRAITPTELCDELRNTLNFCRSLVSPGSRSGQPEFDVLDPNWAHIVVLNKEWNTAMEAVNRVGEGYQYVCNQYTASSTAIANTLFSFKSLGPLERAALGLPIQYFYKNKPEKEQKGTLQSTHYDRRASPLILQIRPLANGSYTTVWTWFNSVFLPMGEDLDLKPQDRWKMGHGHVPPPPTTTVQHAIDDLALNITGSASSLLRVLP